VVSGDVSISNDVLRGIIMDKHCKSPTKEEVRSYMQQRQLAHAPPPDIAQIRRQLGWELLRQLHKGKKG
jgi:hypothetical protein